MLPRVARARMGAPQCLGLADGLINCRHGFEVLAVPEDLEAAFDLVELAPAAVRFFPDLRVKVILPTGRLRIRWASFERSYPGLSARHHTREDLYPLEQPAQQRRRVRRDSEHCLPLFFGQAGQRP